MVSDTAVESNREWDFVPFCIAAASCAIAIALTQMDGPGALAFGGLFLAAALAAFAGFRSVPRRAEAMAVAGAVLFVFGILSLFSVGFPILVAGVIALGFALKTREERRSVNRPGLVGGS